MLRALIPALDVAISLAALASAFFLAQGEPPILPACQPAGKSRRPPTSTAGDRAQPLADLMPRPLSTALAAGLAALRFALDLVTR